MGGGGGGGPGPERGGEGVRVDVNREVIFQKNFWGGDRVGWSGWGGQGRCEQRSEVFVKIQNFVGGRGDRVGGGGQGGCE